MSPLVTKAQRPTRTEDFEKNQARNEVEGE